MYCHLNPTKFFLDGDNGNLQIKEGTKATTTITSSELLITNLVFTNLTASSTKDHVKIDITIEYNNTSGTNDFDSSSALQTSASARL